MAEPTTLDFLAKAFGRLTIQALPDGHYSVTAEDWRMHKGILEAYLVGYGRDIGEAAMRLRHQAEAHDGKWSHERYGFRDPW